jgi:hypothetical protein
LWATYHLVERQVGVRPMMTVGGWSGVLDETPAVITDRDLDGPAHRNHPLPDVIESRLPGVIASRG